MPLLARLAAVVAVGILSWASPAAAKIKVTAGGGCSKAAAESPCREVTSGAILAAQSFLFAGKEGATVELPDRSTIRLPEGSEVRFLPRTKVQIGKGDTPAEVLQISRGKVFAELSPSGGALLMKGPQQMAAILKKGSAVVKAGEDSFLLGVFQGAGVLGSGSDFSDVTGGRVRVVRKGEKPAYRDLLRAPEPRLEPAILLQVGSSGGTARLSWGALPGAEGYEVSIRSSKGGVSLKKLPKGSTETLLDGLEGGDHEISLRGVDAEDLEGPWSAPQRLSLVGMELPPGASAQGSMVQLPEKGRLKIRASGEIEASYDRLTTFVPVPGEVGLDQGKARVLRLRRRGESREVQVQLVPRSYQARIRLTPTNARWPQNPVEVEIELVSGNGMPAPSDIELIPRVTLDQEVLTLSFQREGGKLRATVPPRNDRKPHVVRVEVSDQFGFFLGRNFLEVAAGP